MNTISNKKRRCPRCNGKGQQANPEGSIFKCTKCGGFFDNEPDEGGDWSDRSPAARIERQERRRA